jgi:predicted DNA-binding transcriptional regulator AlpA
VNEQPNTLTSKKAASYLGISEAVLRLWRSEDKGPRFFRAGERLIRYRRADLDSWIEARLSQPCTSSTEAQK